MSVDKTRYGFEAHLERLEQMKWQNAGPSTPSDFDTMTYVDPFHMQGTFHVPPPVGAGMVAPPNPFAQFTYDMCPEESPSMPVALAPYAVLSVLVLYFLFRRG